MVSPDGVVGRFRIFMRRLLLTLPLLCMPLIAAGQTLSGDPLSNPTLAQPPQALLKTGQQQPMQGSLLVQSESGTTADVQNNGSGSLSLNPLAGGTVNSSTVQYGVTPSVSALAGVTQRSWATQPRIISSEVGATYNAGRYSL